MTEDNRQLVAVDQQRNNAFLRLLRKVHRNICVVPTKSSTVVVLVAVNRDPSQNIIRKLSCRRGIPIGGYVYDMQADSYFYNCEDFLHLGSVPVSFMIRMQEDFEWQEYVPMPESVIKTFLTKGQKKMLSSFRRRFKSPEHTISLVQLIDPN